jgi:hypothetical protein
MKSVFLVFLLIATDGQAAAQWVYSESFHKMTSKTLENAQIESANSLALDFPYKGKNHGTLWVVQLPKGRVNVAFQIEKGQLQCTSYSGCNLVIRFDDAPAVTFSATGAADNSSETIFINSTSRFIAMASKAKKIMVQPTIYKGGSPVLEF